MTNWIKTHWKKVIVAIPILVVLIGCGRVFFVFNYGYPIELEESNFTIEDPNSPNEIALTFLRSIAFHQVEGIKPFVEESDLAKLDHWIAQTEQASDRCRYPFDPVLGIGGGHGLEQ